MTDEDYQRLLACIEGLYRCRKLEDFPAHSLAQLRQLLPCQMACYAELDYARQRAINVFDPAVATEHQWFAELIHEHPVLNYFVATSDGQAMKISDFLSEAEFHQLALYQKAFRLIGVEDEMGFGVQCAKRFILGFSFHRAERSFTERDRMLLNLIRPHVVQAYQRLEELAGHEELCRDLQTALRENGLGILVLDATRRIVRATPGVREKLADYMQVPDDEHTVPETVALWAFAADDKSDPLILGNEPARLIIRRSRPDSSRTLLMVSVENSTVAAERLARFNLTPREHEVLRWVAEGKSNPEIATILGVRTATAKTHVERILAKLSVENRTAAASVLRSVGF